MFALTWIKRDRRIAAATGLAVKLPETEIQGPRRSPMEMSVGALDHYNVSTRKLTETVRLYEDALGFVNGQFRFPERGCIVRGMPCCTSTTLPRRIGNNTRIQASSIISRLPAVALRQADPMRRGRPGEALGARPDRHCGRHLSHGSRVRRPLRGRTASGGCGWCRSWPTRHVLFRRRATETGGSRAPV
jgi:hypothetical protein